MAVQINHPIKKAVENLVGCLWEEAGEESVSGFGLVVNDDALATLHRVWDNPNRWVERGGHLTLLTPVGDIRITPAD